MTEKHDIHQLPSSHLDDVEWEQSRFVTTFNKTLFFRDGIRFSLDRFEPGSHTFPHQHGFRQLRYVLDGEFLVNGTAYGPGSLIEFPEFTSYEVFNTNGGRWIVVQFPGTTGEAPTSTTGIEYNDEA
ncbi:cupin domain-containing protein [Phytohabitans suffuscus]|uniref:Cupin 2 conserved barrel domain-containing protein n=1 Tax=Phytohabitans suffuscus TaxID=624315 RepID=A0A6F8YEJ0_9ACTN|nr:hypothetical protein [Phytohabitans suffuscus]BCB84535.1 hypothetical protein Psuf_018480 [Phytohabitans suffuscus]